MLSILKNRIIAYGLIVILSVFIANVEPYFSIENINNYLERTLTEQQMANDIYEAVTANMPKDKKGLISAEDANAIMRSDLSQEKKQAFVFEAQNRANNLNPLDEKSLKSIYKNKITNQQNQNFAVAQSTILLMLVIALLDGILSWIKTIKTVSINYTKSTIILLESACLVWILIAWILFRRNFEPLIVFGLIPIILVNGWFFFKYVKNNEK